MLSCPRCQAAIEPTTIQCPNCRLELKAHGHPGITLHRAEGETALCATCVYEADDSCNFPQRPHAQTCTLYRSIHRDPAEALPPPSMGEKVSFWMRHHRGLIALIGLVLLSLLLVLVR
jgi:hypothetical protein